MPKELEKLNLLKPCLALLPTIIENIVNIRNLLPTKSSGAENKNAPAIIAAANVWKEITTKPQAKSMFKEGIWSIFGRGSVFDEMLKAISVEVSSQNKTKEFSSILSSADSLGKRLVEFAEIDKKEVLELEATARSINYLCEVISRPSASASAAYSPPQIPAKVKKISAAAGLESSESRIVPISSSREESVVFDSDPISVAPSESLSREAHYVLSKSSSRSKPKLPEKSEPSRSRVSSISSASEESVDYDVPARASKQHQDRSHFVENKSPRSAAEKPQPELPKFKPSRVASSALVASPQLEVPAAKPKKGIRLHPNPKAASNPLAAADSKSPKRT